MSLHQQTTPSHPAILSALDEINISREDFHWQSFENNKSRIVEVKSVV